ncbi:MAG: hypothetical protein KAJ18_02335 [Candidatus Omnitrophica bacterium]|nr:hypothetical protein [Candidatus Omnitrophota bacterium]
MKKIFLVSFCLISIVLLSGCATIGHGVGGLFSLLGTIVGGTFQLIGKALDIVAKMPKPPPGIF